MAWYSIFEYYNSIKANAGKTELCKTRLPRSACGAQDGAFLIKKRAWSSVVPRVFSGHVGEADKVARGGRNSEVSTALKKWCRGRQSKGGRRCGRLATCRHADALPEAKNIQL